MCLRRRGTYLVAGRVVPAWLVQSQPGACPPEFCHRRGAAVVGSAGISRGILDLAPSKVTHVVAIFDKREKADLSWAERKSVAALVRRLKEEAS